MNTLISVLEWLNPGEKPNAVNTSTVGPYLKFWGSIGLWPLDEREGTGWFPYVYPRLVIGLQIINVILYTHSLTAKGNTYIIATEQLFVLLFIMMVTGKISTHLFQPIRMKDFCRDLERLHARRHSEGIPQVDSVLRKAKLLTKACSAYIPFNCIVICVSAILLMAVNSLYTRKPFFSAKYPCNVAYSPCLEFTVIHDSVLTFTTMQFMGMADMYFLDILNQIWAEAKIMNVCFKSVREFAMKKVQDEFVAAAGRESRGLELESLSDVTIDIDQSDVSVYEAPCVMTSFRGVDIISVVTLARRKAREKAARRLALHKHMKSRLAECVRHHQALLNLIGDLQSLFNPFLMSQLLNNLAESAVIALHIMLVPSWGVKEYGMILIEIFILMLFYAYAWISNAITSECSKVKKSLYNSDWFDASDSFKRSMRIIICRSNERVVIRLGGSAPLSLETYRKITKTAVSHFLTMRTIASKK